MSEYNGWSNYQTWRTNLELFDGLEQSFFDELQPDSEYELAAMLKDIAIDYIASDCENQITRGYALAFLDDVNWLEIATARLDEMTFRKPDDSE